MQCTSNLLPKSTYSLYLFCSVRAFYITVINILLLFLLCAILLSLYNSLLIISGYNQWWSYNWLVKCRVEYFQSFLMHKNYRLTQALESSLVEKTYYWNGYRLRWNRAWLNDRVVDIFKFLISSWAWFWK